MWLELAALYVAFTGLDVAFGVSETRRRRMRRRVQKRAEEKKASAFADWDRSFDSWRQERGLLPELEPAESDVERRARELAARSRVAIDDALARNERETPEQVYLARKNANRALARAREEEALERAGGARTESTGPR